MDWINDTQKAINYIENNLTEDIGIEEISKYVYASKEHFQKIFNIVTGFSISEYIRNRRLSLAGHDLFTAKDKIIDVAMKYGYETPESFTKAFIRFHGVTPSEARISDKNLKRFSPLTIQINVKGGFIVSRKLIPNVAKLYEIPSENYMFCSCMHSVMSALNESESFDFSFFAGVTGDLFIQLWCEPKWQYNDSYSSVCRDSQVPVRVAFDACGYDYEYIYEDEIRKNKPEYVRKIVDSIDKGYPVLTFGIVGPPICSIICGYDENGDILIGWSQFTDEAKQDNPMDCVVSDNYFSKRYGLDNSKALIFFSKKKNTPPVAESIRKSILNISKQALLPPAENVRFGKQAFDSWADSLLCDEDFKDESMLSRPLDTYGSCMVMVGTNMHYVQQYLTRASELCADISDQIKKLQQAYAKENEALQRLVEYQGGYFFDADRKALLNKDFRIRLSGLVRELGKCFENAANS
jgi:AraC-like DNA-binding protein